MLAASISAVLVAALFAALCVCARRIARLSRVLRALCVAVEYKGITNIGALLGAQADAGIGYEARVPLQFITDARAALQ